MLILSDTFEQFGRPLMRQLNWPTLLCHRLVVDGDRIVGYRLRQPDQKRWAVEALRGLNYRVVSAGDSYNDTAMLAAADAAAALGGLARGAAEDVAARGAREALTGPVVRGDVQTLRAHLDQLSGEESRLYSLLARETLRIAIARGLPSRTVANIEAILSEELD